MQDGVLPEPEIMVIVALVALALTIGFGLGESYGFKAPVDPVPCAEREVFVWMGDETLRSEPRAFYGHPAEPSSGRIQRPPETAASNGR